MTSAVATRNVLLLDGLVYEDHVLTVALKHGEAKSPLKFPPRPASRVDCQRDKASVVLRQLPFAATEVSAWGGCIDYN